MSRKRGKKTLKNASKKPLKNFKKHVKKLLTEHFTSCNIKKLAASGQRLCAAHIENFIV